MTTTKAELCNACHEPWASHSCRPAVQKLVSEADALRAQLDIAVRELERLNQWPPGYSHEMKVIAGEGVNRLDSSVHRGEHEPKRGAR